MLMTRRTRGAGGGHSAGRAAARRLFVQPVRHPGRSDQGAVGAGAEPAAAPQRPDPEPGRDRQGLRAARGEVFKDIADARSRLLAARSPEETIEAANQQTSALGRLLAVVENYPQLKANEQFNRLMDELSGTENRIAVERMRYNERVQAYNTSRRQFPANVTAKSSASRSIRSSRRRPRRSRCRRSTSRSPDARGIPLPWERLLWRARPLVTPG